MSVIYLDIHIHEMILRLEDSVLIVVLVVDVELDVLEPDMHLLIYSFEHFLAEKGIIIKHIFGEIKLL